MPPTTVPMIVPMIGCVASAAPIWPRFASFMLSLSQALKPASLPMEPKKLISASASTTAVAAKSSSCPVAARPPVMNSVVPKRIVKMPQRM